MGGTAQSEPAVQWHLALGPFYDSAGAQRWLGDIDRRELVSRQDAGLVLAMETGDGTWLYPAWQFGGGGQVHEVLAPVLDALQGLDRWLSGVWLVNEHPGLGGRSPRRALRE